MAASISLTLQVRVTTQKKDKVAVTGAHAVLGEWNPEKVKFLKPKPSRHESGMWFIKINVPLSCEGLEYRYLVCRKFNSAHGDEGGEDYYIIRHWESGVFPRYKKISELGSDQAIDDYGAFQPDRSMFVDQGWLINDTEIQLRFYKDAIHLFKKRDRTSCYNIKCCAVNLFHDYFSVQEDPDDQEEHFNQAIHASNPLIRVSSLGKYSNREQSIHGMPVSRTDYVIYKLRTFEFNSHGIKVDIYKTAETTDAEPVPLGYTNILPLHLADGTGSIVLVVNGSHGFPIGQVTVHYLVCKPNKQVKYNLSKSFSKWWNRDRPTLEIGHRGLGNTHASDINSLQQHEEEIKHENTLVSLITAGESGADFVELDVMLSKDKIPIIWHDFKVSILLRKKTRGSHQVHHIPVHELTLSQLKDLRVDFVKENAEVEHRDLPDSTEETILHDKLSPFPTLKEALNEVDGCVGFYVELKYPQRLYDSKLKEEGLESYFERNVYLDHILKVLQEAAGNRRIILASFDADICIMARIKQNLYPVIFLIEDNGPGTPYYHDVRAQKISTAVSVARSEKFLGLSVNAAALIRKEEKLLDLMFAQNMICFVWGDENNNVEVREDLKHRKVHAICHDEIGMTQKKSIYRIEDEERLRRIAKEFQPISPAPSHAGSLANSLAGSTADLLAKVKSAESLSSGHNSPADLQHPASSSHIPIVRVTPAVPNGTSNSYSEVWIDNVETKVLGSPERKPAHNASSQEDYTTAFY